MAHPDRPGQSPDPFPLVATGLAEVADSAGSQEASCSGWAEGGTDAARHALSLWCNVGFESLLDPMTRPLCDTLKDLLRSATNYEAMQIAAQNAIHLIQAHNERHRQDGMLIDADFDHGEDSGVLWYQVAWRSILVPGRFLVVRLMKAGNGVRVRMRWETATGAPAENFGLAGPVLSELYDRGSSKHFGK